MIKPILAVIKRHIVGNFGDLIFASDVGSNQKNLNNLKKADYWSLTNGIVSKNMKKKIHPNEVNHGNR